jgi:pimeloyl-ACP methyl ester carboxylesterase
VPSKTINGVKLAWEEAGAGLPVLLLHAYPLSNSMWATQRSALAKKFRVITPDFRGFGGSALGAEDSSMELFADDVHALLTELKLGRVVLAGLSMGGYVAFAFYRKYASAVRALILADTRAQADSEESRQGRLETAALAEREGTAPVVDRLLPKLLGESTQREKPEVVAQVRAMMLAASPAGMANAMRAMAARTDSVELLARIQCPTLVLVGEEDKLSSPSEAEKMAGSIPQARFQTIPGAGHLSSLEQPARFNMLLEDFLSRLPARS